MNLALVDEIAFTNLAVWKERIQQMEKEINIFVDFNCICVPVFSSIILFVLNYLTYLFRTFVISDLSMFQ